MEEVGKARLDSVVIPDSFYPFPFAQSSPQMLRLFVVEVKLSFGRTPINDAITFDDSVIVTFTKTRKLQHNSIILFSYLIILFRINMEILFNIQIKRIKYD